MRKKQIVKRRIASIFLSLIMLFGEFCGSGISVYAGDEDAVDETFAEENFSVEDNMKDVDIDEEDDVHGTATMVQIVSSGSRFQLGTNGESSYGNNVTFSNGVLTFRNYQTSDNYGGYTELFDGETYSSEVYYGIYANGDLVIELEGENVFNLGLSRDTIEQYGIYTKGSLTIRNVSGKNGSLSIDLNGMSGNGTASLTYDIFAIGDIQIDEQKEGSLELNLSGSRAVLNEHKNNGYSYGIKAYGGNLDITDADVQVNTVAGTKKTYGI